MGLQLYEVSVQVCLPQTFICINAVCSPLFQWLVTM